MKNLDRQSYKNVSGIYKLTSTIDSRSYVGSASCLYRRINNHIQALKKNTHTNSKLQRFYNKYGEDSLNIEVIGVYPKESLIERENYFINLYDSSGKGFNITPHATSIDYKISPEKRNYVTQRLREELPKFKHMLLENLKKARIAYVNWRATDEGKSFSPNKGKKASIETIEKQSKSAIARGKTWSIPVIQFSLDNNPIKEWESMREASRQLNIQWANIGNCCRGKRKTAGGFIWKYKENAGVQINVL